MTSEGLGEMFEGDSADMCTVKFPLVAMVGRVEGLACADPEPRTPIVASGNSLYSQAPQSYNPKLTIFSPTVPCLYLPVKSSVN